MRKAEPIRDPGAASVVGDQIHSLRDGVGRHHIIRGLLAKYRPDLNRVLATVSQEMRDAARDVVVDEPAPHRVSRLAGPRDAIDRSNIRGSEVRVFLEDLGVRPAGVDQALHGRGGNPCPRDP